MTVQYLAAVLARCISVVGVISDVQSYREICANLFEFCREKEIFVDVCYYFRDFLYTKALFTNETHFQYCRVSK